ncbi:MAG: phosphatidylserine decarboxylase [Sphingobacteriia bacterium]|nr:phosphatidylserine decarboxylase [Sphingobacteriia bacterium]
MLNSIKRVIYPIHPEGYPFVVIFAVVTIILAMVNSALGMIGTVATVWCTFFFRDPSRVVPVGEGLIVSPADGVVDKITMAKPPVELDMGDEEMMRISIFLNVFDVHVNRVPTEGVITALHYRPGKFINATLDKASEDNERQSVRMKANYKDTEIAFVQIAGLIARRIVCNLTNNQEVKAGEKFGIIRFGSRMDVYMPKDIKPLVVEGQKAIGGETILADLANNKEARKGEVR